MKANPAPVEWSELPPSTPYGGKNRYAGLEWASGEKVSNLATPTRARPHEGQLWVGAPTEGYAVRKSTARDRVRRKREGQADNRCDCELTALEAAAIYGELARDRQHKGHIPQGPGVEFPHRPGKGIGCRYHRTWLEVAALAEYYREEGYSDDETAEALRASPRWDAWAEQEKRALHELKTRAEGRKARAKESSSRTTAKRRAKFARSGGDTTDKTWRENPAARYFWQAGGYACGCNHPTVAAAVRCAARHVTGEVQILTR